MKKNYWMASALVCVLAVVTTGCSNEELDGTTPDGKEQHATITASIPQDGANTRVDYDQNIAGKVKPTWAAGDAIGVWKAGETTIDMFTASGAGASASFSGSATFTETEQYYAVYPQPTSVAAGNVVTFDLSAAQSGTLDDTYHYMYASAQGEADNTANFTFDHAVSILKLTLNFSGIGAEAPTSLTQVTLSATTGLHNKATLTMGSAPLGTDEGNITAEGTFAVTDPVYLYIFPKALSGIKITATDGIKTYEGTLTDKTVVAGKVYTAEVEMSEAAAAVEFIEVNGIKVAVGNLVADGPNKAKIGAPTDGSLYFQFGSLVGWSSEGAATIAVKPNNCNVASWSNTWKGASDPSADPDGNNEVAGTGDPCRYYLKGTWRLPTKAEFETLFDTDDNRYKNGWSWDIPSSSASHSSGLKLPASGHRDVSGSLNSVGSGGYYWSASSISNDVGVSSFLFWSNVYPSDPYNRASGLAVRCIKG